MGILYNVMTSKVEKTEKGLSIPLSEDLATLLKVEEGTPVSLTFRKKCVELRSVNYSVGESRFDNIQGAGDILNRFGRHFGGPTGTEVFIAEKEYLCLFDKARVVALMKYTHAANDWLAGYDAVYRKMKGPDLEELRENKMFMMHLKKGVPEYVADGFVIYHTILVLEAMMIMGEAAKVYYPDEGPYPLAVTDADKNWCVLIRPKVNWEQAPEGVKKPEAPETDPADTE